MTDPTEPVSVILPTLEWGDACEQLADQLGAGDELLVVCDADTDPVASRDPPPGVSVLVAGEPEGCSGKANAVAYAMERATNDRFVWTDDDFDRESDWLDRLVAAGEAHGPATVVPYFVGNGWFRLVEPIALVSGTATIHFGVGTWAGNAWGGGRSPGTTLTSRRSSWRCAPVSAMTPCSQSTSATPIPSDRCAQGFVSPVTCEPSRNG